MYLHRFVWNLRDYAKAIAQVPADDFEWARQIYDHVFKLMRPNLPDTLESVHASIEPIGFHHDDWWTYCLRHTQEVGGASLTTHFDIEVTNGAEANVCVAMKLPDVDEKEQGFLRLYTRGRQFSLYWYGAAFVLPRTALPAKEAQLISRVRVIEERSCAGFHGEIRLGRKRAYRIIRAFVAYLDSLQHA